MLGIVLKWPVRLSLHLHVRFQDAFSEILQGRGKSNKTHLGTDQNLIL